MSKRIEILKHFWGFDSFRLNQEDIIQDVINGHDTLALLPTGGGKSICFQVPGIAREGITVVVSPLIALMQDQVKNLNNKGIKAKALVSGMSYRELDITLDNARFGGIEFLYTSPERLQSRLFQERFKRMQVGLIVVDEAHCISEWGHDFRPAYKKIKQLREFHPEVPIIALTATATEKTQDNIVQQLELRSPKIHKSNFERGNLKYFSYLVPNKLKAILNYCKANKEQCGIVYCQTRKAVKFVAKTLHANGLSVGIYHGGMAKEDRSLMLQDWLMSKRKIMVATNAFGMGIDKPDVRFVLHYEFPVSLEAYFQEAGRAGRDGNTAKAINFWEEADKVRLKDYVGQNFPSLDTVKLVYRALCNHLKIAIGSGLDETFPIQLRKFCSAFKLPIRQAFNALKILELNGELVFSEGYYHPTKLKFAIGNTPLYNFQIKHDKLRPITTLLSRSYPGIFDQYFEIHEKEFCKRLKLTKEELENQLKQLEQYGVIDISWSSDLPTVTFLHDRMPDDYLNIQPEIYRHRKELAQQKIDACLNYLTTESCRAQTILRYFNAESESCGTCDNCLKEQLPKNSVSVRSLLTFLKEKESSLQEIESKFKEFTIRETLRELELAEKITCRNGKYSTK